MAKVAIEGGNNEMKVVKAKVAMGESNPRKTSWNFGNAFFQCAACFPMGDDGRSKTTQMKTNDIEYILFTGNGVDANESSRLRRCSIAKQRV